jgi:hypothetical protein
MRPTALIVAAVLLTPLSNPAFAQRPDKVAQALKERYPDTKTELVGEPRQVNGVDVYRVRVLNDQGESTATVTEFGDFLSGPAPVNFDNLSTDVRQVRELLRSPPNNVQAVVSYEYVFDVTRGGDRLYRLHFDPLGRLRSITNPDEGDANTARLQKASNSINKEIDDAARRHVSGDQKLTLQEVYKDPHHPNFYDVKYEKSNGKEYMVTVNEKGTLLNEREELAINDVPAPVRESFSRMFNSDKVRTVYRVQESYVQFEQTADRNNPVVLKVHPDGSIMDVRADLRDSDASLAAERLRGSDRAGDRDTLDRTDRNSDRPADRISSPARRNND